MALHLHRAPRTDLLADALGDLLSTPLDDPFATELVLVPARGVERWLSQRLSHRLGTSGERGDGVCAGVEFRFPRSLVAELTGTRDEDPWAPDALAWPLLSVLDASLDEPWAATLAAHLGHRDTGDEAEFRRGRRYSVARRLAGLFASYAAQRPQLLRRLVRRSVDGRAGWRARRRPRLATAALARTDGGGRRTDPGRPARRDADPARGRPERPAAAHLPVRAHADAVDRDRAAACAR